MIKNYKNFLIQEGMITDIKNNVEKAVSYFKEKFKDMFWFHFGLYAQKKGWFKDPKTGKPKVEIFIFNSADKKALNMIDDDDINESSLLNEDRVKLESYDKSIRDVNVAQLVEMLISKYDIRLDDPDEMPSSFIWGAPGIGKTDVVKQLSKKLNINLIIWHLATIDPCDFIGVPQIEKIDGRNRSSFALPKIFPLESPNDNGGIIFLDELNLANNLVLSAAMRLCLDGEVTDYKVPPKWLIISAGNRKEDVNIVNELSPALANRFAHFNLLTTVEDWTEWAINNKKMDPTVISFINFNRDAFHYLDLDLQQSAWPSPRTWAKASSEYVMLKKKGDPISKEKIKLLFSQYVGDRWANEYVAYLDVIGKFSEEDIKDVYNNPDKAKLIRIGTDNIRLDHACSIMSCVALYMKQKTLTKEQLENVFKYSVRLENMELASSLLSYLNKAHPYILSDPNYGWRDLYLKYWYPKYKKEISL